MICLDFPVIYSTLSAIALVERVLPAYGLRDVERCDLWHRGMSDIYLVQTPHALYVLRISHHHWRSRSEVLFELEFLDFLRQQGIPVSAPIRTTTHELMVEIGAPEGLRYGALFPYAPGQIPLGDFNVQQSWQLGSVVADMHKAGHDFVCEHPRKALDLDHLLDDSLAMIFPFFGDRPRDWGFVQDITNELKETLHHLPREEPFWTVCWGDPHSGNVHFNNGQDVTLFDFDQCGYGWRAFEIAKFFQIAITAGLHKNVREAFLAGYQSIAKMSEQELKSLQAFSQVAHFWMWSISIESTRLYDNSRLDQSYFTQRLQRLKYLNSHDWQLF